MNTLQEVVDHLLEQAPEEMLRKVIKENPDADAFTATHHDGYGTGLRNYLNLYQEDSADLKQDIWDNLTDKEKDSFNNHWRQVAPDEDYTGRNMHADDASSIIMARVWEAAKEKYSG